LKSNQPPGRGSFHHYITFNSIEQALFNTCKQNLQICTLQKKPLVISCVWNFQKNGQGTSKRHC